jgi:hypothetical protein
LGTIGAPREASRSAMGIWALSSTRETILAPDVEAADFSVPPLAKTNPPTTKSTIIPIKILFIISLLL